MTGPFLLLTALDYEARAIARRLGGVPVEVVGLGARLQWSVGKARTVVLTGLAGGLDPALQCGDIVLDETSEPGAAAALHGMARVGPIASINTVLTTASEKEALFARTGALAVDMEATVVRQKTTAQGLAFVHLRAISDSASQSLDPVVASFVDERGRPRLGAVTRGLLKRPSLVVHLTQLRAQSVTALERLCPVLAALTRGPT